MTERHISPALARRYIELRPRLTALWRQINGRAKNAPDAPAGPMAVALTAALLVETYGLVSREPCGRALPRTLPEPTPTNARLLDLLGEANLALEAFEAAHYDDDEMEWMVFD